MKRAAPNGKRGGSVVLGKEMPEGLIPTLVFIPNEVVVFSLFFLSLLRIRFKQKFIGGKIKIQ